MRLGFGRGACFLLPEQWPPALLAPSALARPLLCRRAGDAKLLSTAALVDQPSSCYMPMVKGTSTQAGCIVPKRAADWLACRHRGRQSGWAVVPFAIHLLHTVARCGVHHGEHTIIQHCPSGTRNCFACWLAGWLSSQEVTLCQSPPHVRPPPPARLHTTGKVGVSARLIQRQQPQQ